MSEIILKSRDEIELIRESSLLVSKTLGMLASEIKPGITSLELDKKAEEYIRDNNAEPGFLGLYDFKELGFTFFLCKSIGMSIKTGPGLPEVAK